MDASPPLVADAQPANLPLLAEFINHAHRNALPARPPRLLRKGPEESNFWTSLREVQGHSGPWRHQCDDVGQGVGEIESTPETRGRCAGGNKMGRDGH